MGCGEPLYRFPADIAALPALQSLVDRLSANFDTTAVLRAQTALDELFSNIVHHGVLSPGGQPGVGIAVQVLKDELHVHIEDECEPFDPFAALDGVWAETELPLEERRVGGLGCLMVHGLADQAHYMRDGPRNCVDLCFRLRPVGSTRDAPGGPP